VTGRTLAAALAAIALLTFVLPPLAARQVHLRRIDRARQGVERLATALTTDGGTALAEIAAGPTGGEPFVLAGPGAAPVFEPGLGWPAARVLSPDAVAQHLPSTPEQGARDALGDTPDPWGNQYLAVVGASPGPAKPVTVISAGPNGTIETPFGSASTPRGDDIVAVRQ
jgi:hypothetical protein